MNDLEIFIRQGYRKAMYPSNYTFLLKNLIPKMPVFYSLCIGIMILLTGCQSTSVIKIDPYASFHDELLQDYKSINIESEQEVFSLGKNATAFVNNKVSDFDNQDSQIKALAESIFNHSELNLLYNNDANTTASETFKNKAANCLSLTIMTYAMADYAGLGVRFQQVSIPEIWVRREGTSLLNRHVNLRLYPKSESNVTLYNARSYRLDFDRRTRSLRPPVVVIDKQRVLAMFYNNKGADALIKEKYSESYAYLRQALITEPQLIEGWTNLGILYRRVGRLDYAENTYNKALTINKNDPTTWENLAYIYRLTNRQKLADDIIQRIKNQRLDNHYYHFMLGEVAYEKKNYKEAVAHYRRAIKLNKNVHEFYFAVAKSYYQLGDIKNSQKYVSLAKKHTHLESDEMLYQSKINILDRLEQ